MKTAIIILISIITATTKSYSQDTFSIVAADSTTREVGSAGASCVDLFTAGFTDPSFLGDLLPDTGSINTQANYLPANQNNARARLRAGDTPSQIISWLTSNDATADSTARQYGIVSFSGNNVNAAAYTGINCLNYKNHITGNSNGIYYSIQGNILLGQQVLDSMQSKFINASGDLACRLMAALQGAKITGADTRCTANGTSSLFAFIKVAQPTDAYGSPSLMVTVRTHSNTHIEPIDTLQTKFNLQHSCSVSGLNQSNSNNYFQVYPNPSKEKVVVVIKNGSKSLQGSVINIYNLLGKKIDHVYLNSDKTEIDLSKQGKGIYFFQLQQYGINLSNTKIVIN